ncbi:MAG: RIP metalloprotease RseP [Acidobacteriota bacterium]|nr:MAG: RIP metalloprotease RseP [Acidobacteriota bacterium]
MVMLNPQVINILWNIFWAAVALGVLIFLHEAGHFLVARRTGVGVETFSFGFGPRLFGKRIGETDYRVSLIPLGGYVKLLGEEPDEELRGSPREFGSRTRWERAKIYLAGPGTNLLLAYVLIVVVYTLGVEEPAYLQEPPVVGYLHEYSPALEAGLQEGDLVLSLDGEAVADWDALKKKILLNPGRAFPIVWEREGARYEETIHIDETDRYRIGEVGLEPALPFRVLETQEGYAAQDAGLQPGDLLSAVDGTPVFHYERGKELISAHAPGEPVALTIERQGKRFEVDVALSEREGKGYLGVVLENPPTTLRRYAFPAALAAGGRWMGETTVFFFEAVRKLVTGRLSLRTMSGPVDIAKFSGAAARASSAHYIYFLAFLSLNLGIINLLPIPLLDGGHLFFLLIEGLRRRDLSLALKERLTQVGFVFLISLMGVIVILDILKNLDF